jgi:hypothetical protein
MTSFVFFQIFFDFKRVLSYNRYRQRQGERKHECQHAFDSKMD